MSSTRTKNTNGNYNLETQQRQKYAHYCLQDDIQHVNYAHPGNGLMSSSKVMPQSLSYNHVDIESFLHGTSSSNFVEPFEIQPLFKPVRHLNIYERKPTSQTLLPEPFQITPNQRPVIP